MQINIRRKKKNAEKVDLDRNLLDLASLKFDQIIQKIERQTQTSLSADLPRLLGERVLKKATGIKNQLAEKALKTKKSFQQVAKKKKEDLEKSVASNSKLSKLRNKSQSQSPSIAVDSKASVEKTGPVSNKSKGAKSGAARRQKSEGGSSVSKKKSMSIKKPNIKKKTKSKTSIQKSASVGQKKKVSPKSRTHRAQTTKKP